MWRCIGSVWCTNIPLCPWFWRRRMLAAKNGEALNERTFGRQKMRLAIPSWWKKRGNDCDVAVGNCRYVGFSPWWAPSCMRGGKGGGREISRAGNFILGGERAPLKVAPFCQAHFFTITHHSFSALLTRFQCESNKPMTSSFIDTYALQD